jgi:predicted PurR-regulated permease PerM
MRRALRIDISTATILRILITVAAVWLWMRLWQWVLLYLVAAFIAVGLDPLVSQLDARGFSRRYGAPIVVIVLAGMLVSFAYFAGASLIDQLGFLGDQLEQAGREIARRTPKQLLDLWPKDQLSKIGMYAWRLVPALVNGMFGVAVALLLAIYLLLDGRRTYEWLVAFAPPSARRQVRQTADEARIAALAYVRGNVVTSVIAGVATYIAMHLLHVPAALLLGVLAGILDFVPVLGVILSTVPAVLLALTVSMWAAVGVVIFHGAYNMVENYYIAPKVYGRELRMSSLAIITAFAVGAELGGVIGALVSLPIAAMYPTIERIWLGARLGPATVEAHEKIQKTEEH